jgi:hypothetical protein
VCRKSPLFRHTAQNNAFTLCAILESVSNDKVDSCELVGNSIGASRFEPSNC